jgi:hypothetical protein
MKYDFSYKSAEPSIKIKNSNPCTNRPVLCEICSVLNPNSFFWSYNLENHYSLSHTNVDLPEEVKRIKNEKIAVLKKFKTKNKIN